MTDASGQYFQYWGKAKPSSESAYKYHLLVFHSLDVAAVGVSYLKDSQNLLKAASQLLNCSEAAFLEWTAFLLALHDLGKFSEAFQSQREDLISILQHRLPNPGKLYSERHDSLGFWLWDDDLVEEDILLKIGIDNSSRTQRGLRSWMQAVTGHHGMPPKANGQVNSFFLRSDKQAAAKFVQTMASLLLSEESKRIPTQTGADFETNSQMLSWWFAGVTVLADWLGSNTNFFPYQQQVQDLDAYWHAAKEKADSALAHSGVLPVPVKPGKKIRDFFAYIDEPSPLQQWAATANIPQSPQIYLLEDVTGAGKTEAALMLAYRLMAQGAAEGFFIGLPTMATANAMYHRIADVYRKLFEGDANLTLAHGFKTLVDKFAISILPEDEPEHDPAQSDETATARCTAWLADHTKRALLASAGVGTIDQALLAVLHSKHQSLRLLGLYNKVLIVDEVHACDAYMQGVLEVLLNFHARTNGSVILLSATLPADMKQNLISAYARGRNQTSIPLINSIDYPLATCWYDGQPKLIETAFSSRANVSRTVQVHYESDIDTVYAHVDAALRQGQCVGWIRNTVADAMAAYERFAVSVPSDKITLFHARFSLQDRLNKEAHVLQSFGGNSTPEDRHGRLMIATQVAEQSLDVDFDVLISDLAPIDRVLQRAGRLQRHVRDTQGRRIRGEGAKDGRPAACLWVFAPAWTVQPKADWYGAVFKTGQYVYKNHGQLWLSAQVLQKGCFTMPTDARTMIEQVFSKDTVLPTSLTMSSLKAQGQDMSEASLAQQNTLKIGAGYQRGDIGDWWSEAKTPSRLGEETTEIMLAKWAGNNLEPWASGVWSYSMVKVATRKLARIDPPSEPLARTAYDRLQKTLPGDGKWCGLLALSQQTDVVWKGQAWTAANEKSGKKSELLTWLYDENFGLRVEGAGAENAALD